MKTEESVRIDKWLWAVRIYKTRSLATEACKSNKVRIADQPVKPSREVKVNDTIVVSQNQIQRTLEVKAILDKRVGAKLVEEYLHDLTPQEEYDKLKMMHVLNHEIREKGIGRPTKKERRLIEKLKKSKF
ncbi:MAG: RNA-binding S4 domain-containing protein [Bacteroidales bacterium]|nr:RNA-binding S4 domain-containing protein [Bacteroidales bacterium]MCF8403079.1 RNA-binding S4 domain-containing protein [Bacteroidales bacterium]